jgi:alpha-galactosidase
MFRIVTKVILTASLFASSTAFASTITAKHSGKVVDIPGWSPLPGVHIIQWSQNGGPNQNFDVNNEADGYVTIFNPMTRQCLDVANESRASGAPITQWWCHKHDNQLWRVERQSDGYVRFRNKLSQKCMAVSEGSRDNGAAIVQSDCRDVDEQRFRY